MHAGFRFRQRGAARVALRCARRGRGADHERARREEDLSGAGDRGGAGDPRGAAARADVPQVRPRRPARGLRGGTDLKWRAGATRGARGTAMAKVKAGAHAPIADPLPTRSPERRLATRMRAAAIAAAARRMALRRDRGGCGSRARGFPADAMRRAAMRRMARGDQRAARHGDRLLGPGDLELHERRSGASVGDHDAVAAANDAGAPRLRPAAAGGAGTRRRELATELRQPPRSG